MNMKTARVLWAVLVLVVGGGHAIAADESPSTDRAQMQKLVGTWKGTQGQVRVDATYTFWIEQGRLFGKSEYHNLKKQEYLKGALSEISVSGDKVRFVVEYSGGEIAGSKGIYELTLKGSLLKGRGRNIDDPDRIREFGVKLKRVE